MKYADSIYAITVVAILVVELLISSGNYEESGIRDEPDQFSNAPLRIIPFRPLEIFD